MYDPGLLYFDPILTGFSIGFQDQNLYGERVMPTTPVTTPSGRYRVFDRSNWIIFLDRREPGTVANEVRGRRWSEDTFFTKEHSLQVAIHDEERQEYMSQGGIADPTFGGAAVIEPERDAVELVTRSILLGHELKVANLVRNTANYPAGHTVTLSGTAQWDQDWANGLASASNPLADIRAALTKILVDTGNVPANTMILPRYGQQFIENHPRIVDRFKTFTLLQDDAFQLLTGFQGTIYLVDSVYNAADNYLATPSVQQFWGKDVWVGIVEPNPGQNQQTFGKTFSQQYPNGGTRPTDRWREEGRKSDIIRVSQKYDLKITSSIAGYLIKNAFSSGAW